MARIGMSQKFVHFRMRMQEARRIDPWSSTRTSAVCWRRLNRTPRRWLSPRNLMKSCGRRSSQMKKRSEEHTSELQSRPHLVCRLLLEKKKKNRIKRDDYIVIDGVRHCIRLKRA